MKRRMLRILLASWLIFLCVSYGTAKWVRADELTDNIILFGTVLNLINKYYVDEIKLWDVVYPAIKEMVNQLDPHSHFLTPEEVEKAKEREKTEREYAGVGMIFGSRQDLKSFKETAESGNDPDVNGLIFEIKKIFDGSPAQRAGLFPKDEIAAIDGVPTKDVGAEEVAKIKNIDKKIAEKMEQIRQKIIGPAGTSVTLTIKRQGWSQPKDFVIIRGKIQVKNVEWKILENDGKKFGYLRIESFESHTTAKEVEKAVAEFKKRKIKGAIIDLRNNPGGRLDYCVDVLESFLAPKSLVVSNKGRVGEKKHYTGKNYKEYFTAPLVVLINAGSASASEIVAGTLRDYKKAALVGKKTYGKGSVQVVQNFPDGSQLRLTAFKYFLPNGECIHEKGISPHIEAETEFDEPIMSDALNVLKNWGTFRDKFLK